MRAQDDGRRQSKYWCDFWRSETSDISAAAIGIIYAALGNMDEAFRWLERAYNDHDSVLTTIAFYPGSQPLRGDPRFSDLITRVGLDPAKAISRRD
jgi:hypothetical protein